MSSRRSCKKAVRSADLTRPIYSGQFTTDNYSKTECQCRKLTRSAAPPDLRLHTYCGDLKPTSQDGRVVVDTWLVLFER